MISELKALGKPFAVVLNTLSPASGKTQNLRKTLETEYGVPVAALNIAQMEEEDIRGLLERVLGQFPVSSICIQTPEWLGALDENHWLMESFVSSLSADVPQSLSIGSAQAMMEKLKENPYLESILEKEVEHGSGRVIWQMNLKDGLFNQILAEQCGTEIRSDAHLLSLLRELVAAKREYDRVESALKSV